MVGGFVEHEDVGLLQHKLAEEQARGFTAGENAGGLGGLVALEEHLTEQAPDFFADGGGIPLMEPVQSGHAACDEAAVVLSKISDGGFVAPDHFAIVDEGTVISAGLAKFGLRRGGRICEQGVDQGGLPCSVAAHQCDAFAAGDAGSEITNNFSVAVGFAEVFDFKNVFAGGTLGLELDVGACDVRPSQFRYLQAFHFFAARLHLARTCAGGEAGDEFVQLGNLFFALRILRFDLRADLSFGQHHFVVGSGVGDDRLVIDVGNVGADAVEKVAIVRDGDDDAVVGVEKSLEPVDRIQVEVVGGFVEQQGLGMAE